MNPRAIKVNWKTSLSGVVMILTAIGTALNAAQDGDPSTVIEWEILIPAIIAGVGLIFSRDADKTSEASAARR